MGVHLECLSDLIYLARWYEGGANECFQNKVPYKAVATLIVYVDSAWIYGLHGTMTRSMRKDLVNTLLEAGIHTAFAIRRGEFTEWDLLKEAEREVV